MTAPTSRRLLRMAAACASLDDKSNSIKAGARGPAERSGGTGRLAMRNSKRSTFLREYDGQQSGGVLLDQRGHTLHSSVEK